MRSRVYRPGLWLLTGVIGAALAAAHPFAQDRLPSMPGYEQFTKMQAEMQGGVVVSGAASAVTWSPDGRSLTYDAAGNAYRFDLASMTATVTGQAAAARGGARGGRPGGPPPPPNPPGRSGGMQQEQAEMPVAPILGCPTSAAARGRQADCVVSPDGKLKAFYRARNLWIANVDGSGEHQITTDGSVEGRIKNGTASWVYGEELGQTTAIWWSPDSTRVAYYRFDESQVKDFFLQMNQTGIQTATLLQRRKM